MHLEDSNIHQLIEHHVPNAKLNVIERMTGGVSAEVYRLDLLLTDGSKVQVVLRCHGATHFGHSAELEFKLLEALYAAGVSVPKPLCFDASCTLLEHPFLIIDFVEGSSAINQSKVEPCIDLMVEKLILVHEVQTETMPSLPLRVDPVPELLKFLPQGDEWKEFRGYLSNLTNTSFVGPHILLHGDFWPSNLIWSDGQIAAILDWEDAALGDPLSDVACACLELQYIYGDEGKDTFERAYAKHQVFEKDRLALWLAYVSAASLKHMGDWGLENVRETHMRQIAQRTLRKSASGLL